MIVEVVMALMSKSEHINIMNPQKGLSKIAQVDMAWMSNDSFSKIVEVDLAWMTNK